MIDRYEHVLAWVASLGGWGPLAFVGVYVTTCVFLLPGFWLTCGAGLIFGFPAGAFWVSCSSTLGAALVFGLVRLRPRRPAGCGDAAGPPPRHGRISEILDQLRAIDSWKTVALIRLCPIFPFRLSNYLFALTNLRFPEYIFGTWLGTLPGAIAYTSLGASLGSLAEVFERESGAPPARIIALYLAASIVLFCLMIVSGRSATRAIGQKRRRA